MNFIKKEGSGIFKKFILLACIFCGCIILWFSLNQPKASRKGGTTLIASWNFKDNIDKTNTVISLADTITKSYCDLPQNYIAPGTEGAFDIVINASGSNLKINYFVKLIKEENTPSNLYFFMSDTKLEKKYSSLKELFKDNNFSGTFDIKDEKIKTYRIFWKWPFETFNDDGSVNENKDLEDLNYAKLQKDYIFEIEISGMQS